MPEHEFYLHKIDYERLDNVTSEEAVPLNCADNINVDVSSNGGVKVIVTRSLYFEPEELFRLSVAFGANLKFEPQKVSEYNWNEINLAEEFRDNGDFVTVNLISRITLLIAQITSSSGQQPLLLSPVVAKPTAES